jgi:hypothetical protein
VWRETAEPSPQNGLAKHAGSDTIPDDPLGRCPSPDVALGWGRDDEVFGPSTGTGASNVPARWKNSPQVERSSKPASL